MSGDIFREDRLWWQTTSGPASDRFSHGPIAEGDAVPLPREIKYYRFKSAPVPVIYPIPYQQAGRGIRRSTVEQIDWSARTSDWFSANVNSHFGKFGKPWTNESDRQRNGTMDTIKPTWVDAYVPALGIFERIGRAIDRLFR